MLAIIFDLFICSLMGWAIYVGIRLDKRLRLFQKQRETLDQLSQALHASLLRAETGLKNLQEISNTQGNFLQDLMGKAQHLHDELSFVIDHGEKLSARLEEEIHQTRRAIPSNPYPPFSGASYAQSLPKNHEKQERAVVSLDSFKSLETLR